MRFNQSTVILILIALLVVVFLANRSPSDESVPDAIPGTQAAQTHPLSEQRLAERVEARWAALAAGDFTKAYGYETPGYRDTVTPQQFQAQFGSAVQWHGAEVRHLEVADTGDRAEVEVLLDYEVSSPIGNTYSNRRPLNERWIASDGDWWYVRD